MKVEGRFGSNLFSSPHVVAIVSGNGGIDATLDPMLDCLARYERRFALEHLAEHGGSAHVDELTDALADHEFGSEAGVPARRADQIATALLERHLPRLEDNGIVEVDGGTVRLCDRTPVDVLALLRARYAPSGSTTGEENAPDAAEGDESDEREPDESDGPESDGPGERDGDGRTAADVRAGLEPKRSGEGPSSRFATRRTYHQEQEQTLTDTIVDAIVEHRGDDLLRTDFELYEDVDFEALDELFRADATPRTRVAVITRDVRVELWGDGSVQIRVTDASID